MLRASRRRGHRHIASPRAQLYLNWKAAGYNLRRFAYPELNFFSISSGRHSLV